jgi:hypothetical protein
MEMTLIYAKIANRVVAEEYAAVSSGRPRPSPADCIWPWLQVGGGAACAWGTNAPGCARYHRCIRRSGRPVRRCAVNGGWGSSGWSYRTD